MMEIKQRFKADPKLKLMDQVRQVLRYHHYAYQTEKTYCERVLAQLKGIHQIMARLLYGGGLRLMECVRLRVQDLDN
jgi:integrase